MIISSGFTGSFRRFERITVTFCLGTLLLVPLYLFAHPSGIEFEVLDADPRRVKRLRLRGLAKKPSESQPAEHG